MASSDFSGPLTFAEYAVRHYGKASQVEKSIEELRELDEALTRYLCAACPPPGTRGYNAVIDEIADVLIMAIQLRVIFGGNEIDKRVRFKIERQLRRMRGEE